MTTKRLHEQFQTEIIPILQERLKIKNRFALPRMKKVTLNIGLGRALTDKTLIDIATKTLEHISGQRPTPTKARNSISGFKLRKGTVIGLKVTLRGARMYDFIEKLIRITFPRVSDFRGISKKTVDSHGNLSVGFREHIAFPEISADDLLHIHGLQITVTTTAEDRKQGLLLFELLGFPFKKEE